MRMQFYMCKQDVKFGDKKQVYSKLLTKLCTEFEIEKVKLSVNEEHVKKHPCPGVTPA